MHNAAYRGERLITKRGSTSILVCIKLVVFTTYKY